jgi:hypothetical protein
MQHDNVQFDIAEVLSTDISYTYSANIAGSGLHIMYVRSITDNTRIKEYTVKPIDLNNIKLPVVGEIILTCKTVNRTQQNHDATDRYSWYYLQTLALQSGINNNRSTGMSYFTPELNATDTQNIPGGRTFDDKFITSPLQLFEGDSVYQGRNGQSIRFGTTLSTQQDSYYYKQPTWLGETAGDPIIIISNGRQNLPNKEFVVEDINQDAASLYLTSTQKLPIILGNNESPNSLTGCLTPGGLESNYIGSQLIGISDRVIIKAKTDLAVIDSPLGIVLNSTGQIKLGSEDASESMVHGDVLLSILQNILNQLQTGIVCGTSTGTFINLSYATKAQKQLQELLSSTYFINKNTY